MRYIFGLFFILVILTGCSSSSIICSDCGDSGWQLMNLKCNAEIQSEEDLADCILNYNLYSFEINTTDVILGYIEIGKDGVSNNSYNNSIRVYSFNQWAADKDGNLYLESMLG